MGTICSRSARSRVASIYEDNDQISSSSGPSGPQRDREWITDSRPNEEAELNEAAIVKTLAQYVASQGGTIPSKKIQEYYQDHPAHKKVITKGCWTLRQICEQHPSDFVFNRDSGGLGQFMISLAVATSCSRCGDVGPTQTPDGTVGVSHILPTSTSKADAAADEDDMRVAADLVQFLLAKGGWVPASDLGEFYSGYPSHMSVIKKGKRKLFQFCNDHPEMLACSGETQMVSARTNDEQVAGSWHNGRRTKAAP